MERKAKILLIDDVDFVTATKTVLETQPYEVIVAYNGEERVLVLMLTAFAEKHGETSIL